MASLDSKFKINFCDISENHQLRFECEKDPEGEFLDTKVSLNKQVLCWISWSDVDGFKKELKAVINKYKI